MGKHHKHKKHRNNQQADDREMYVCEVCKKRFPFDGHVPPASTPFMFMVFADYEHRRFSLQVCSADMDMQPFEGEEALWFVCSDRQCISKSFLMWREFDRRMHLARFAMQQTGMLPPEERATPLVRELDQILLHPLIDLPSDEDADGDEERDISS